jgi:hypothetical protein
MNAPALLTIAAPNYLAHVRSLIASFQEFHPKSRCFLCLVGRPATAHSLAAEPFEVFSAEALDIPGWEAMAFRYDVTELSTAVKPFALRRLLDAYGFEQVIYLDPDALVYADMEDVGPLLRDSSILLTPHRLAPSRDGADAERLVLQAGVFNLGFIAVARRVLANGFLTWWETRLSEFCIAAPRRGLFVDQKWMDLAAVLFEDVRVWRDPGCNVAWWNLSQRRLESRGGRYWIDDRPLRFFHFSGFRLDAPLEFKFPELVPAAARTADLTALLEDYGRRLRHHGIEEISALPYPYSTFDNHDSIELETRCTFRELDPGGSRWPHPFETGRDTFHAYWMAPKRRASRYLRRVLGENSYETLRSWLSPMAGR